MTGAAWWEQIDWKQRVADERREQGLPATVRDDSVLEAAAALMRRAAARRLPEEQSKRRRRKSAA